jgi:hypothetical protein
MYNSFSMTKFTHVGAVDPVDKMRLLREWGVQVDENATVTFSEQNAPDLMPSFMFFVRVTLPPELVSSVTWSPDTGMVLRISRRSDPTGMNLFFTHWLDEQWDKSGRGPIYLHYVGSQYNKVTYEELQALVKHPVIRAQCTESDPL